MIILVGNAVQRCLGKGCYETDCGFRCDHFFGGFGGVFYAEDDSSQVEWEAVPKALLGDNGSGL